MSNQIITLPSRGEMLERLRKVDNDGYMEEKLFWRLLEHAGRKLVSEGVVVMLVSAISKGLPKFMVNMVCIQQGSSFIDALVVNRKVAKEAKLILQKAISKLS